MPNPVLGKPTGYIDDLAGRNQNVTMWYEAVDCPNNAAHQISCDGRNMYCAECGIYWDRKAIRKLEDDAYG